MRRGLAAALMAAALASPLAAHGPRGGHGVHHGHGHPINAWQGSSGHIRLR